MHVYRITVIITCYNSAAFIRETLDSIFAQRGHGDKFELEVIVVDDYSQDDTVAILGNYDLKLITLSENSGGPNKGRNIGLALATGDLITIADHDDIWDDHRVLRVLEYVDQASIISSGYRVLDTDTGHQNIHAKRSPQGYIYYPKNETFVHRLRRDNSAQTTYLGTLFYSSALRQIRFEETRGQVDYDWVLRLFQGQDSLEICEALYTRTLNSDNLSLNEAYRRADHQYSLETIERYRGAYPEEVSQSVRKIHGTLGRYYYIQGRMPQAREYLKKSGLSIANVAYYLSSYIGHQWIRPRLRLFR